MAHPPATPNHPRMQILKMSDKRLPERGGPRCPGAQRGLQRRGLDRRGRRVLHRRLAQRDELRRPRVQCILQPPAHVSTNPFAHMP